MKYAAALLLLAGLTACSPGQDRQVREQAHETGEVVKHDAREALHDAKVGTEKASREIDKGLRETREKVRKTIDAPPDDAHH